MQKYLELLCRAETVVRPVSIGTVSGPFLEYDPYRLGFMICPNPTLRYTISTDKVTVDGVGLVMLTQTHPRVFLWPYDGTWIQRGLTCISGGAAFTQEVFTLISKVSLDEWLSTLRQTTTPGSPRPNALLVK